MTRSKLLLHIFFLTIGSYTFAQSTWTGAISNRWNNADNWNPSGVPGIGDDVIINSGDVNISSSPVAEINGLTMNGGTLELFGGLSLTINGNSNVGSGATLEKRGTLNLNNDLIIDGTLILQDNGIFGAGDLTINGNLNWSSGAATVDITGKFLNTGTINITSAQLKTTLDNQGMIEQNGTFTIHDNGKYINNGMHDIQGNGDINEDGANFGFTNNGSLIKSAGTSRSDIQPVYDGSGSVEAQVGTIDFRGPSTQSGTLISSGGSIRFPTFTHSFLGVSIQGDGFTEVNGATITVDSDVSATNLKFDGGEISGTGNLTVTNSMIWLRGRFGNSVDQGQVIISNDFLTDEINGYFLGTTLINNGNAIWRGGQWVFETNGVFINNNTFDVQTNADMDGSSKMIINNGTWTKSGGINTTFISPIFTNNGTVSVEIGTLQLFNGSNTGTITTTSGATLDFGGSSSIFTNESGGTIGGVGEITINGSLVNNGSLSPGSSPGILTIPSAAKLTFGTTSIIEMELGGTTVGTEYDQMDLTGTFALDGTLNVTLINSFNPSIGDSFDLIKYTNHTGQFATINLPTITGLSLDVVDENGLIQLSVSEENIAPILDNSADLQLTTIDEDDSNPSGNLISNLENGTGITLITDPNGPAEGIAVIAVDNANGLWQYSLDNGSSWTGFSSPSISNARLLLRDEDTRIRFVSNSNFNGIINTGITFHAWDQYLGAAAGGTADISINGGITPFSSISETISITVNPINDAPTLSNAILDQTINEDEAFNLEIPNNTFEDIDVGDALILSATLTDDSNLPAWLTFDGTIFSGIPDNGDVGIMAIKLTATDLSGAFFSDQFDIEVVNTNDAPTLINPIADQQTNEDETFSFAVPTNTFEDVDATDMLTLSAVLADDSALPAWLTFDGTIFSGIPGNGDVGIIAIKLTATDLSGAFSIDQFDIEVINTNDAPILINPIADQQTNEDETFSFLVPANTFEDVDEGDILTLNASLADDSSLPSWLMFDGSSFSGTPSNDEVGIITIKLTATDPSSTSVSNEFDLEVINVNDAPVLDNPIDDQTTEGGKAFSFSFPENTFSDVDLNDVLTYSATLSDDSDLPIWLSFDNATRTFSGTPENAEANYSIKVTASDISQAVAIDEFDLNVSLVLALEDFSKTIQVQVFPNPFENQYQLQLENAPVGEIEIEIFDAVGRMVYFNRFMNKQDTFLKSMDFYDQPRGVYFLNITYAGGSITNRMVKK